MTTATTTTSTNTNTNNHKTYRQHCILGDHQENSNVFMPSCAQFPVACSLIHSIPELTGSPATGPYAGTPIMGQVKTRTHEVLRYAHHSAAQQTKQRKLRSWVSGHYFQTQARGSPYPGEQNTH